MTAGLSLPWRKISAGLWNRLPLPFERMAVRIEDAGDARSPAAELPLNKICDRRDWEHPAWRRALEELGYVADPARHHRKEWEFAQAVYGLRKLRCLSPDAVAPRTGIRDRADHLLPGGTAPRRGGDRPLRGRLQRARGGSPDAQGPGSLRALLVPPGSPDGAADGRNLPASTMVPSPSTWCSASRPSSTSDRAGCSGRAWPRSTACSGRGGWRS